MPEATKRPWKRIETDTFGIYAEKGIRIAEVMTRPADKGFGFADEGIANADLIVKAVNNHDALVAALEVISGAIHIEPFSDECDEMGALLEAIDKSVIAALEQVKS